jgi:hypothetical protein
MRPHRLARLALLTKGAALVGLGSAAMLGCHKDEKAVDPDFHINAPPDPTPHANATATPPSATPSASAPPDFHINAPPTDPQQHPHTNATATPPSATAPVPPPPPRIRTNAPAPNKP